MRKISGYTPLSTDWWRQKPVIGFTHCFEKCLLGWSKVDIGHCTLSEMFNRWISSCPAFFCLTIFAQVYIHFTLMLKSCEKWSRVVARHSPNDISRYDWQRFSFAFECGCEHFLFYNCFTCSTAWLWKLVCKVGGWSDVHDGK